MTSIAGVLLALAVLLGGGLASGQALRVEFGLLPDATGCEALALAANGEVVAGRCFGAGSGQRAFRWTEEEGIAALEEVSGEPASGATGVSADGSVIVGWTQRPEGCVAFRWTVATGVVPLWTIRPVSCNPGDRYRVLVSADGEVVAGPEFRFNRNTWLSYRWTTSAEELLAPPAGRSNACPAFLSADGTTLTGIAFTTPLQPEVTSCAERDEGPPGPRGPGVEPFRWTSATGSVVLGLLPFLDEGLPAGLSGDGSILAGTGTTAGSCCHPEAFRWTEQGGLLGLGTLTGAFTNLDLSLAKALSADGAVVVGTSAGQAFRWDEIDGMVGLGFPAGGYYCEASAASADGAVVAGYCMLEHLGPRSFVWDAINGIRLLDDALEGEYGITVPEEPWTGGVRLVSADGRTLASAGVFVRLPADPCANGVDDDGDGLADFPEDPGCLSEDDLSERQPTLACDDGLDDPADGDQLIDFPADPGCASPIDPAEIEATLPCDNGVDDDGDGLTDFPDDPGCLAADDPAETDPTLPCDNGMDDDGDGLVDFPADPNCIALTDPSEMPVACDNGVDDDGDGLVDFGADPGCDDRNDPFERSESLACDDGFDNDGDGAVDFPADADCQSAWDPSEQTLACSDGVDNDGDGAADYPADGGCANTEDDSERGTSACDDGVDNDGDGDADYPADGGCVSASDPAEEPWVCFNGLDDDGDGRVDYEPTGWPWPFSFGDPGCESQQDDSERGQPGLATPACDNDLDENANGLVDYPDDPACYSPEDRFEEGGPWAVFAYGGEHALAEPVDFLGIETTSVSLAAGGVVASDVLLVGESSLELDGGAVGGSIFATMLPCNPFSSSCDGDGPRITLRNGGVAGGIEAASASLELHGGSVQGSVRVYAIPALELPFPIPGLPLAPPPRVAIAGTDLGGDLELDDDATATLTQGRIGGSAVLRGQANVAISGGSIGGDLILHEDARALLSGGVLEGGLELSGSAYARVSSGLAGGPLIVRDRALVEVVGRLARVGSGGSERLVGTLADGTPVDFEVLRAPGGMLRIVAPLERMIDDFEEGPFAWSVSGRTYDTREQWALSSGSVVGGARRAVVPYVYGGPGSVSVGSGAFTMSGAQTMYVLLEYDGLANDHFDSTAGRLFADLSRGGRADALEIEVADVTGRLCVRLDIFGEASAASNKRSCVSSTPYLISNVFVLPLSDFPGVAIRGARAMRFNFDLDGRFAEIAEIRLRVPEPGARASLLAAAATLALLHRRRARRPGPAMKLPPSLATGGSPAQSSSCDRLARTGAGAPRST